MQSSARSSHSPVAGGRIVAAAAQQQHVGCLQFFDRRRGAEQIEHVDRRDIAVEHPRKAAHLLRRHRVARIARLQQQIAK